ncbi:MAG: lamin tail domain-containing protein [Candidatus Eisenbacteria bacterium]|nr:lamin tail domain-containing protein [Candidatus Eisenbacteria bacterium]
MLALSIANCAFLPCLAVASSAFAANAVRISQVYGGGGGSTGTYLRDYVEIYNNGNTPVNIGGWTLQYGSAAGNWGSSAGNIFTFPVGTTIQPCQYMLLEAGASGTAGVALPVAADFSTALTGFSMSGTTGKVALFSTGTGNANVACGAEAVGTIVDKVSYGGGNCPEGTNVGTLSSTQGAVRNNAGVTDTDNNLADFTIVANPVPRNSASPRNASCLVTPTSKSTWGAVKSIYR